MKIFVIADTHFGHQTLADEYHSRPPDFDQRIINNWSQTVNENDLVIHLGDVLIGNSNDWLSVVPQLPGRKILVLGNHDKKNLQWYMTNGIDFESGEYKIYVRPWSKESNRVRFTIK